MSNFGFSLFGQIKCLNLYRVTAGSMYFSIVLLFRGGSQQKRILKIFSFLQPAQSIKESLKFMVWKNVTN